jgi:uncharacterized OB-fold protein
VVHRSPRPELETPYVLAIVDIDEGWSLLTNVVGCEPRDVRIGMAVCVSFLERLDRVIPVFAPTEPSDEPAFLEEALVDRKVRERGCRPTAE